MSSLGIRLTAVALVAGAVIAVDHQPVRAGRAAEGAVLVTVVDKSGAPVKDLTTKEFLVREDGVDRQVTGAKIATDPMVVALMLDTTEPRQGNPSTATELRKSADAFVKALQSGNTATEIGLMEFSGAAVMTVPYTTDSEALDKNIRKLFPSQRNNAVLLEGLVDVSKSISKKKGARRVIVSLDFSSPETSETPPQQVADEIRKSGAAYWAVSIQGTMTAAASLAGEGGPGRGTAGRELVLANIPTASGGMHLTAVSNAAAEGLLTQVAACLLNQYVVTYARPDGPASKVVQATATRGDKVVYAPMGK